jgi:hypothetical protein
VGELALILLVVFIVTRSSRVRRAARQQVRRAGKKIDKKLNGKHRERNNAIRGLAKARHHHEEDSPQVKRAKTRLRRAERALGRK